MSTIADQEQREGRAIADTTNAMPTKRTRRASKDAGHAPDLELLGDTITLQPRGFEQDVPEDGDKEQNLVEHMARFRTSPLEYALLHFSLLLSMPDVYVV